MLNTASKPPWEATVGQWVRGEKVRISPSANLPVGTARWLSWIMVGEKSRPWMRCEDAERVVATGFPVPQPRSRIWECGGRPGGGEYQIVESGTECVGKGRGKGGMDWTASSSIFCTRNNAK